LSEAVREVHGDINETIVPGWYNYEYTQNGISRVDDENERQDLISTEVNTDKIK